MMPTNDERREVASELRHTASHSLNGYSFQRAVEGIAFGTIGDRPWKETMKRLADLIEPEPERTCSFYQTDHEYEDSVRCSECRMTFNRPWEPFKYCPNCGAKVVQE